MTLPKASSERSLLARRAFSLIELLVVITIIAVVIAITVPALSGARDLARKAATESTVNSLVQAAAQFRTDEQRAPGYFSPEEMGNAQNLTLGLTAMQNMMLELVGGIVEEDTTNPAQIEVGPSTTNTVFVDTSLINVDKAKSYYTPNADDYKVAVGIEADQNTNAKLPMVHDAWGIPILAWIENDLGSTMNDSSVLADFAQLAAPPNTSANSARYYWMQNSAVLSSRNVGTRQIDMPNQSLIGFSTSAPSGGTPDPVTDAMQLSTHLAALLGSPNSFVKSDAAVASILPRVGRGPVVFHSAGSDRVFVSAKDKGYGRLAGQFIFGRNLTPGNNVASGQYPRPDGTQGSIDIVEGFDDIVTAAGG